MKHIIAATAGEGWLKAARHVYEQGHLVHDGDATLKESLNIFLTVREPLAQDDALDAFADPAMIAWMRNNFLNLDPIPAWGYSYGQRFFNYDGLDQVAQATEKLRKNPDSKSATVALMDPSGDGAHMPCLTTVDFKIRDGRLMTTAFFRSQDVGKKMYADVICLGEIAWQVAKAAGAEAGALHLLIVSLHAYEADWNKIERMLGMDMATYAILPTHHLQPQ